MIKPRGVVRLTLAVDFDGVIHSYESGWRGETTIPDPPVPGALAWLIDASEHFNVVIHSSRCKTESGIFAIREWLKLWYSVQIPNAPEISDFIEFSAVKPPAFVTLDDRSICFDGTFPSMDTIRDFKPWFKKGGVTPPSLAASTKEE